MQAAAMFKVMKNIPTIPENLSAEGKDFLRCCFRRNPAERPTASKLLEHRFLKNSQHADVASCSHSFTGMKLTVSYKYNLSFFFVLPNSIVQLQDVLCPLDRINPKVPENIVRVKLISSQSHLFCQVGNSLLQPLQREWSMFSIFNP